MQTRIQPECKRDKVAEEKYLYLRRRKYQDEKLMICFLHQILLGLSIHERIYGRII
jgi:hypothetical protein